MRILEINLATRPFRNNTLYWTGFGTAAGILAILSAINVWLFVGYGSAVELHEQALVTREARTAQLTAEEQRLARKLGQLDFPELAKQAEFANGAIRRRIFSWTELFNRLEEVVPPAVMMSGIRPEIQEKGISVLVGGMAKTQEGLLDFEENMIQNSSFAGIYPGNERREERGNQLKFFLKFEYVPETKPEQLLAEAAGLTEEPSGGKPEESPDRSPEAPEARPNPDRVEEADPAELAPASPAEEETRESDGEKREVGLVGEKKETGEAKSPPPSGVGRTSPTEGVAGDKKPENIPTAAEGEKTVVPVPEAGSSNSAEPARDPFREPIQPTPSSSGKAQKVPASPPPSHPVSPAPPPSSGAGPPMAGSAPNAPVSPPPPAGQGPGVFRDAPVSQVFNYLKTWRSLRFILDGEFDLNLRLTADLREMTEAEILKLICDLLYCQSERKAHGLYQLTGSSQPRRISEPAIEEEPLPGEIGKEDPS